MKKSSKNIEASIGSGNVYEDFGYVDPEEAKAKARLAILIINSIKRKKLTQAKVAELIGIDQPKISKIMRGVLAEFSIERLMRFLVALGYDIEISAKKHLAKSIPAGIYVINTRTVAVKRQAAALRF